MNCPLCQSSVHTTFSHKQVKSRAFFHCDVCDLIFADPNQVLSLEDEKSRYEKHHNNSGAAGYQQFLLQFVDPLLKVLKREKFLEKQNSRVLDFGCGPARTLSEILTLHLKVPVLAYDPFFADQTELLKQKWDLIVSTEVCEHFRKPAEEFRSLKSLLASQGILALMTQFHQGTAHFSEWWYARDLTHVVFYSVKTWQWIAEILHLEILYVKTPVVVFVYKDL
jgi:2-polyprenyl-3-methyl-5-hydroxy-6-metoxy-1,4-benzoquinol methylase